MLFLITIFFLFALLTSPSVYWFSPTMRILSSFLLFYSIAVTVVISAAAPPAQAGEVLCVCRCCYLGDCAPLANTSWLMNDCTECTAPRCRSHLQTPEVRNKIAKSFEWFRNDNADGDSIQVTPEEQALIDAHQARSLSESAFDVCEVVAVTEAVSCARKQGTACKVSTDITAECYDRNQASVKYTTWLFLITCFLGIVFGLTKNHLPAFQEFNAKNFDY